MLDSSRLRNRVLKMPTRATSRPASHHVPASSRMADFFSYVSSLVRCQPQPLDLGHDFLVKPAADAPRSYATVCSLRSGNATGLPLIVAFGYAALMKGRVLRTMISSSRLNSTTPAECHRAGQTAAPAKIGGQVADACVAEVVGLVLREQTDLVGQIVEVVVDLGRLRPRIAAKAREMWSAAWRQSRSSWIGTPSSLASRTIVGCGPIRGTPSPPEVDVAARAAQAVPVYSDPLSGCVQPSRRPVHHCPRILLQSTMLVVDKNRHRLRFAPLRVECLSRTLLRSPQNVLTSNPSRPSFPRPPPRTQIPASLARPPSVHADALPSNSLVASGLPNRLASVRRSAGPTCPCRIRT